MIYVSCRVREDEIIDICVWERGVSILEEAIEKENYTKSDCGSKDS